MQRQPQQILEYLHESGTHSENVHASADAPASHFQAIGHVGVPTSEAIPWPWTSSERRAPWDSVVREIWSDPSSPSFQMFSGPSNRL